MAPFTLRARLAAPIIRRGSVTLDALLMALLGRGDVSDLLLCEQELYFASAGIMAAGGAVQPAAFVASMRPEQTPEWLEVLAHNTFNTGLPTPDGAKGRARYNDLKVGLTRQRECGNVISSYTALSGESIEWYATGQAQDVLNIVKDVPFIGKRRSAGYGEVAGWEVEAGALDGVRGFLGEPLRPIPVDRWTHGGDWIPVEAAWKAPYWDVRNRTKCLVPEIA